MNNKSTTINDVIPLHPIQEGIYFDQQINNNGAKYNVGGYIVFVGKFNKALLNASSNHFRKINDSARTKVFEDEGKLWQSFPDEPNLEIPFFDLSDDEHGPQRARQWMQNRMDQAMEFCDPSLEEQALFRIHENEHWYFLRQHHLCADAFSFSLRINATLDFYNKLLKEQALPEQVNSHYLNEVETARQYLDSPEYKEDEDYWTKKFTQLPDALLQTGIESKELCKRTFFSVSLPENLRHKLIDTARATGANLQNLLLLAVSLSVTSLSGRSDIIAGTLIHNRVYRKQKSLYGMLASIVPIRFDIDKKATLGTLLKLIKRTQAEDLMHRHYPWSHLLRQVRSRNPNRQQLFDIVVNFEPYLPVTEPEGLKVLTHKLSSRREDIPLWITLSDFGERQPLQLNVDCASLVGDEALIQALSTGIKELLIDINTQLDTTCAEFLMRPTLQKLLAYQTPALSDMPLGSHGLDLPKDRLSAKTAKLTTAAIDFSLSQCAIKNLSNITQQLKVPLPLVIYCGWAILLARLSSTQDFSIKKFEGGSINGSREHDLSAASLRISTESRLADFLATVNDFSLCQKQSCHSQQFSIVELHLPTSSLSGDEFEQIARSAELSLSINVLGKDILGSIYYPPENYDETTIQRWVEHLKAILESMLAAKEQSINEVALLTSEQSKILVDDFNQTPKQALSQTPIHQLFAEQVTQTPDNIAVTINGESLTYAELNTRAQKLSQLLQQQGVSQGCVVGVCLERSQNLVVTLLAIWKAGAAYLPLDPSYPEQRLAYMLKDSQPLILVSQSKFMDMLSSCHLPIFDLDNQTVINANENNQLQDRDKDQGQSADNLAYVIYTSGSTGYPKGVMVEHLALSNFVSAMCHRVNINETTRLLAITTIAFDISVLELFGPLLVGGEVVLAQDHEVNDGAALIQTMSQSSINLMQATPSTWQLLLNAGWAGNPQLTALCGGEEINKSLIENLLSRCEMLWNCYGPTEATVWSMVKPIDKKQTEAEQLSIGHSLPNLYHFVLDENLQPLPIGVAGQLFIGGIGLARGYWAQDALTASKFTLATVADKTLRLYQTGDRVCWLPNGTLKFLGRIDNQIKLRGFRIETGEIESRLLAEKSVAEAVVLVREEGSEKVLSAFVTPKHGKTIDENSLREQLRQSLPNYMVPALIVTVDKLPQTLNCKVNRRLLSTLKIAQIKTAGSYLPPVTDPEKIVAKLIGDLLGVDQLSLNTVIFEMGWHSIMATQAATQLAEIFQVEIPVRILLMSNTVSDIVVELSKLCGGNENLQEIASVYYLVESMTEEEIKMQLETTEDLRSQGLC